LKTTGEANILHSVKDLKWGIGLHTTYICHPVDPKSSKGQNLFGTLLMVTRSRLANLKTEPRPNVPPQSTRNVQVHLVGNSIIGGIDPARLSTEKVHVKKSMVYTIDEAKSLKYNSADMIIFQLGSNDPKKKNPEQVVMDMDNRINKIHRHNPECKIVVYLVPHQKPTMNSKIKMLNTTWNMKFKNSEQAHAKKLWSALSVLCS
jgi:hypothetical protein